MEGNRLQPERVGGATDMALRTPDEMMRAAKDKMLAGREPESHDDWARIMNFLAFNVEPTAAQQACRLMKTLYDIPLTDNEVAAVVDYQLQQKRN